MKKLILLLLIAFTLTKINAQTVTSTTNWECGANTLLNLNFSIDTNVIAIYNQYESALQYKSNLAIASPTPYIIPVVFHVIKDAFNNTPIPTYQQIQWQLATLNAAFSNSLASLNGGVGGAHASNTQIQFCLAKYMQTAGGPVAWPTANVGLMTYTTNNTAQTSNISITNTVSIATLASLTNYSVNFPPNMYLNIWCVPNITLLSSGASINAPPSVMGIGTFPWMTLPIDGIIMRNDIIGNNTYGLFSANMYAPYDRGTILAHEVGHYLGLFHTFETLTGSNITTTGGAAGCYGVTAATSITEGDLVYDTPPTLINGPVTGTINSCNEMYAPYGGAADEIDLLEDVMCYSDDNDLNTFTIKQGQRMYGALDASWSTIALTAQRFNLTTNANLSATGVINFPSCGPGLLTSAFNASVVASSISCSNAAIQFVAPILPGYITGVTYSWTFGDGTTSTLSNPLHIYNNFPTTYIVTLIVSNGASSSTTTQTITIPVGGPKIVGQSGNGFAVCKGTEQTVLIQFPVISSGAVLTDGTTIYNIPNNFIHNCSSPAGVYTFPFTFTVTNSVSFSLVPASCGSVSNGVATFTAVDCCNNLINNGDLETGNTGFYSNYVLTNTTVINGAAAINFPSLVGGAFNTGVLGTTGKAFFVDSWQPTLPVCAISVGSQSILLGQGLTGLKPNTNYYVSFKVSQSYDSTQFLCYGNKFNLSLKTATSSILNKNIVTSTIPTTTCSTGLGGSHKSVLQIINFVVTTPSTITTATSFSIEIAEIDYFSGLGHDLEIDNIILREIAPAITITPTLSTICPSQTVQLLATGNSCTNLSGYTLVWTPNSSLSCSNCPNPIASPTITTNYVLLAIPPITNPPSPNLTFSTTVTVANPINSLIASSNIICGSAIPIVTLAANGVAGSTYTWLPSNANTSVIIVSPTVTTTYTVAGNSGLCTNSQTFQVAVLPPISFTNTPTTICTYKDLTYLENYLTASTPTGGSFSNDPGMGVIYSVGTNSTILYVNPNLTTIGTHTIYYCYTSPTNSLCSVCNQFTINVLQGFGLNTNGATSFCSNIPGYTATISASSGTVSGVTYTWQPGSLPGATQTVAPVSSTLYTVTASNGACSFVNTVSVAISNSCCAGPNYINSSVIGIAGITTTYNINYALNQNVVVQGTVFIGNNFAIAPNVKITVPAGQSLWSNRGGVHLYACNDMWDGIEVQNGGTLNFTGNDVIEDAKTAIESNGCTSIYTPSIGILPDILVQNVTFNSNYIGIKIANYTQATNNTPFVITNNVFTCRNFSLGAFPTSFSTALAPTLIAATGPTNSLSSPYLVGGFGPTTLKAPYATQPAYAGVYIENSGTTANPTSTNPIFTNILIGEKTAPDNSQFNLFDNLMFGIYGYGSNLESQNNTYQNTRRFLVCSPRCRVVGGYGIYCVNNYSTASNNYLLATHPSGASNNGRINKFYDCFVGVGVQNMLTANVQYANFRSSQTTANPAPNVFLATGNIGIYSTTNLAKNYKLSYNTMQNLNYGVFSNLGTGNLNLPGQPNYGQYFGLVSITNNTIIPKFAGVSSIGVPRVNIAVYASNLFYNSISFFKEPNATFRITDNTLTNPWRGVQLYGFNFAGYSAYAANNTITLVQDPNLQNQWGVYCANGYANVINSNIITGFNTTNTLVTGVYNSMNSAPTSTAPALNSIQCNSVTNLFAGFEFASYNVGSFWRNNDLQTNKRGLYLSNNGIIGQQGNTSNASDNRWNGTWNSTNPNTVTDGTSFANLSSLYVRNGSPYNPIFNINISLIVAQSYNGVGALFNNASGPFVPCNSTGGGGGGGGSSSSQRIALLDSVVTDNITFTVNVAETQEIYKNAAFNEVVNQPTLATASPTLNTFYTTNMLQTRGLYKNIQASFAQGNLNGVATLLAAFTPSTNIENNYKNYYTLLRSYTLNGFLTIVEQLQLLILAHQCPFVDGAVVYEARGLYNLINETVVVYNDNNCSRFGFSFRANADSTTTNSNTTVQDELLAQLVTNENTNKTKFKTIVEYKLYPNPAINEVAIISNFTNEKLDVKITDVNGKLLLSKTVLTVDYKTNLKFDLLNGIYFVNLTNEQGVKTVKKLVIAK